MASLQALGATDPTPALEAHNTVRSALNQGNYADQPLPNPPLALMFWDDGLAEAAQRYSAQCLWQHSNDRGHTGENLYASSSPSVGVSEAVQAWASEHLDYDFRSDACTAGAQCGHYTQLVWQDSLLVGCGQTLCRPLRLPDGGVLINQASHVVCRYAAAGNITGMSPYDIDGIESDRLPIYSEQNDALALPNVLIWDLDNVVTPLQAILTLVDRAPFVFAVESVGAAPFLAGSHTPLLDIGTMRLFLAQVDTLLDGAWSRHSAILEHVPDSSEPLLFELRQFR